MEAAALAHMMHTCNQRIYSRPVLLRNALRALWQTRDPLATMFAWRSNVNYRNVATVG